MGDLFNTIIGPIEWLVAWIMYGFHQAFTFIGEGAFSHTAGELRVVQSGSDFIVQGDVDGDGIADLVIQVTTFNGYGLDAPDFML